MTERFHRIGSGPGTKIACAIVPLLFMTAATFSAAPINRTVYVTVTDGKGR